MFLTVVAFAYGFQQVFSGRAAMLHTGAVIATWMTGNVFFVIMPNQRKAIAELVAAGSRTPPGASRRRTALSHNNYLTLPVLFFMLSGHYPMAWSSPYSWTIVGLVVIAGGVVRHYFNVRNAGGGDRWWTWGVATACVAVAVAISVASSPGARERIGLSAAAEAAPAPAPAISLAAAGTGALEGPAVDDAVMAVVGTRCAMCHAAEPSGRA
ncbi:urate hydroxylase PuuD [Methylobacterium oryzae CBMB20]